MKTKLFFEHASTTYSQGEEFVVHVMLDTDGQQINAIEGAVYVDPLFTVVDAIISKSDITFWVAPPAISDRSVPFSGIVTGGVNSKQVKVLSLTLKADAEGVGTLNARDIKVLKNDGMGTMLGSTVVPESVRIVRGAEVERVKLIDNERPESFVPLIGKDPSLFEGDYFVAFYTQDKGSGIKEYKVKEGLFGGYVSATSPYRLKNQRLDGAVYVKAIDMRGNERIEAVSAENPPLIHIAVVVVVVLLGVFLWKRTFSKR